MLYTVRAGEPTACVQQNAAFCTAAALPVAAEGIVPERLGYQLLFAIQRVALTAGLARSRAALIYGLPRGIPAELPADPLQ